MVSVIIPCHDDGAYLEEALASVRAQTLPPLEVLIVDDGSTDPGTRSLLARLDNVLPVAHGGVCAARNHGLAAARGKYVCFLDADDRLRPTCLEACVARLESRPDLTFVSFWVELFGDESWVWRPERCDLVALLGECCVATAAVARREDLPRFDSNFELGHEDWDLWLAVVTAGGRGEILPEVLFEYRRRAGSRSAVADSEAGYLELLRARVRKYQPSYRAQLVDLLVERDATLGAQLAHAPDAALAWQLTERRARLQQLRTTLASLAPR